MSQTIDVTGLSPEAVRVVERFVASLREQSPFATPESEAASADADARWQAALEAAKGLSDYDFAAWEEQRTFDRRHAQDHLR